MSGAKKQNREFTFLESDYAEILSLVDNSVDFQSDIHKQQVQPFRQWKQKRKDKEWKKSHLDLPIAEHGFSMLIRVFSGDKSSCILFDTGGSPKTIIANAERMSINLSDIECVVLSHGHYDHFGGLANVVKKISKRDLPIIVHENMFKTRGSASALGKVRRYPNFPSKKQLHPARLIQTKKPYFAADGMICVTGEIPRKTSFETGYAQHKVFTNGVWKSDPLIEDERGVIINIREKGLVVLSGCAHAGIINTVKYAQQITGIQKVYAIMGGFHLAGKTFENRIQPTIKELKKINPKLVAPSHCTGWKAMCAIAKTLPEAFVWNSVGNLYKI
jgi:7,8-dihydropterin-6-yl-methyl-4-(beta-D-ribofuranosyl)aminobenzene 5'-phosphate synthase